MSYYTPKHFELHELVPPRIYHAYKADLIWQVCFDWRVLYTGDRLRLRWGPAYANNYHWGGTRKERGLRVTETVTGAKLSQHKFGRAEDLTFRNITAEEARQEILNDPMHEDFKYITCIEVGKTITWLHIDTRNWDKQKNGILQVVK